MNGQPQGFAEKVGFSWSVADLLSGVFRPHEYGQVILPFVVLRRSECSLAPTKQAVIVKDEALRGRSRPTRVENVSRILQRTAVCSSTPENRRPPNSSMSGSYAASQSAGVVSRRMILFGLPTLQYFDSYSTGS